MEMVSEKGTIKTTCPKWSSTCPKILHKNLDKKTISLGLKSGLGYESPR
jgi:hypothetical protein